MSKLEPGMLVELLSYFINEMGEVPLSFSKKKKERTEG